MTESRHFRILLVDDNPAIHEDFRKILLRRQNREEVLEKAEAVLFGTPVPAPPVATFHIDSAYQGKEALEKVTSALKAGQPYALAFLDVRMPPGWDGLETLEQLWQVDPALQCVICTAYADYSWDKISARLHASDGFVILKKPFDNIEVLQLAHALTTKWLVTQQAQLRLGTLEEMCAVRLRDVQASHERLRYSEERFATVFRASPMPQAIQHFDRQHFVDVNEAFARLTGFSREELIGHTPLELSLVIDIESPAHETAPAGEPQLSEALISTRGGDLRPALVSLQRISILGEPHLLLMAQDVSERQRLEGQLRQAQKMEAIGQLAAGIAHDFNNLLTIIQGHSSLQLSKSGLAPGVASSLHQIEEAASRAAQLTRQLLAFSRQQVMQQRALDLTVLLRRMGTILHRLLGAQITVWFQLPDRLPAIFADPTNIEQVVINLVVNSRDAMPRGGQITISARVVQLDAASREQNPEALEGSFVCLSVADNGVGMDEATRGRIFEPFFTTKEVNKGTGMGLATVYGIAKQHHGWVEVESAPDEGATFRVYLPTTDLPIAAAPAEPAAQGRPDRVHTILVVEDDHAVRGLVVEVLKDHHYRVLEAENADLALEVWSHHGPEVELLLTDIVMPGTMNGLELGRLLQQETPALKVIYSSGYSSDIFTTNLHLQDGINYLPKPYLFSKLTQIIFKALEEPTAEASGASDPSVPQGAL